MYSILLLESYRPFSSLPSIYDKVDVFNLATRELPPLLTSAVSFISVQMADAHWLADPFIRFLILACSKWNGQVETNTLSRFNRTAMLTDNNLEIGFGRSS